MKQPKTSFLTLLLIGATMMACQQNAAKENHAAKSVKKVEKKENEAPLKKMPKLTPANAAQELTEYGAANPENEVVLHTRLGDIKIWLYTETPIHRANFVMLSKMGYFDKTEFYRVIKDFMIQGGGTDDLSIKPLQRRIGKYLMPAEVNPNFYHKRGAVSMAREYENNPEKRSAPFDFFIVTGRVLSDRELDGIEREHKIKLLPSQRATYKTMGGAAHLDGDHTVFGEVVEGMDIVEKISRLAVSSEDNWPLDKVGVKVSVGSTLHRVKDQQKF